MDEQYIKLLKELANNIENSISQANETSGELDNAEYALEEVVSQIYDAKGMVQEARSANEGVIADLEDLHADVESEIQKEQNDAINAG